MMSHLLVSDDRNDVVKGVNANFMVREEGDISAGVTFNTCFYLCYL